MSKRIIVLLGMYGITCPDDSAKRDFLESDFFGERSKLTAPRDFAGTAKLSKEKKERMVDECVNEATGVEPGTLPEEGPYEKVVEEVRLELRKQFGGG